MANARYYGKPWTKQQELKLLLLLMNPEYKGRRVEDSMGRDSTGIQLRLEKLGVQEGTRVFHEKHISTVLALAKKVRMEPWGFDPLMEGYNIFLGLLTVGRRGDFPESLKEAFFEEVIQWKDITAYLIKKPELLPDWVQERMEMESPPFANGGMTRSFHSGGEVKVKVETFQDVFADALGINDWSAQHGQSQYVTGYGMMSETVKTFAEAFRHREASNNDNTPNPNESNTQLTQEQTMTKFFETRNYLNGRDLSTLTDSDIYLMIKVKEQEIRDLESITTRPVRLTRQIEEAKKELTDLVAFLDKQDGVEAEVVELTDLKGTTKVQTGYRTVAEEPTPRADK